MQKMCAALLRKRFRYLSIVPWNLVLVDTPEGALEILRQWRARPPEDHDHLTRRFMEAHEADVVVVSEGGEPSDPLRTWVRRYGHTALSEEPGEGYHRWTNHEHVRAPSSTTAHLKQNARIKSVIRFIRSFVDQWGSVGRDVVRFEEEHWQRILQTQKEKQWQRKRMHPGMILDRVYREDELAGQSWASTIDQHVPNPRPQGRW